MRTLTKFWTPVTIKCACCGKKAKRYFTALYCLKCTSATMRPLQIKAAAKVAKAIRDGKLKSLSNGKTKCTDCKKPATEYDHRDYRKPLKVEPVCRRCNSLRGSAKPYEKVNAKYSTIDLWQGLSK